MYMLSFRVAPLIQRSCFFSGTSARPFGDGIPYSLGATSFDWPVRPAIMQRRSYVFLPTSWTELRLRLRQKANPTVLKITLQRHTRRFRRLLLPRLRLRRPKPVPFTTVQPVAANGSSTPKKRGFFSRVREMFTGKGAWRLNFPRSVPKRRPFSQEETVQVTIEDHLDPSWFDQKGRPLVSRDETGRFVNPWMSESADGVKPLSVLWKWREQRLRREIQEQGLKFFVPSFYDALDGNAQSSSARAPEQKKLFEKPSRPSTLRFTLIGHATSLIQQNGVTVLTDPIFSERASPFPRTPVGVARARPPACSIGDLPKRIDVCLISHDHYDHLDKPSVQMLRDRVGLWVVPLGTKAWMVSKGKVKADVVTEMEWWESIRLRRNDHSNFTLQQRHSLRQNPDDDHPAIRQPPSRDELWISCLPVQHWCSRTLWDRNYRLWASFAVLFPFRQTFYFTGDTAFPNQFPLFSQIRSFLPWPISLAAIPIGAYEPAILNEDSHANPDEAVKIHQELGALQSVAIHHGSFALSEEPLDEPARWLSRAVKEANLSRNAFVALCEGESIDCSSVANRTPKR